MPQYMLLLHDPKQFTVTELSPDEIQAIIEKHQDWQAQQREQGRLVDGSKLSEDGRVLMPSGSGVAVKDGPYSEGKEVLGGFYLIEAASYDEAGAIARDLVSSGAHFGTIEVRQIETE
jgi:hypothetical protein